MDHIAFLLQHCRELIHEWQQDMQHKKAVEILNAYTGRKGHLGSRDRRFIRIIFWTAVRKYHSFEKCRKAYFTEIEKALFHAAAAFAVNNEEELGGRHGDEISETAAELGANMLCRKILSDIITDIPAYFIKQFRQYLDDKLLRDTLTALQKPSGLHIRVNTHRADREDVMRELEHAVPGRILKEALRLPGRPDLIKMPVYRRGKVEIQDEASQLIAYLCGAEEGMTVVDAAAGAGGKSLHLSAIMKNKGRIIASDVNPGRLNKLQRRAERSGSENIVIKNPDDLKKEFRGRADILLIDAPCSGSGTLRRSPDLLYRQSGKKLKNYRFLQRQILDEYAELLKIGGVMVYATCSLFYNENQEQTLGFIKRNPQFTMDNAVQYLNEKGFNIPSVQEPYLILLPQMFDSDGFFAARLIKSE